MSYESFPRPVACMLACIKLGSHYSFVLVLLTGNDKIKNNRVMSMADVDDDGTLFVDMICCLT